MRLSPSEDEDLTLAEKLVFAPNGLDLIKIPRGACLSADFEILQNAQLVAYCELKSPCDDCLDKLLDLTKPFQIVGGGSQDPIFNKIRRHTNKASKQFQSVNPKRAVPNILVFVNHDDVSNFGDLREAFTGFFYTANGNRHATMLDMAASLKRAKSQIDLCVWIDRKTSKVQGYLFNQGGSPDYFNQVSALLGINPVAIKLYEFDGHARLGKAFKIDETWLAIELANDA